MDILCTCVTLFIMFSSVQSLGLEFNHGFNLPTDRPLNIAHRGSSGTHPEHTIPAYEHAIAVGADVIECDVLITKDLELVCLHDAYLSTTTDVEIHPEFTDRKRTMDIPENGETTDWFCFDFTLAELKTLGAKQRHDFRDQKYNGEFKIPTLKEFIQVAKSSDLTIGIYPELKIPQLINGLDIMKGKRVEDIFLDVLEEQNYGGNDNPCFIQSFDEGSLKYLKPKTQLPLMILVWHEEHIMGPHLNESKIQEWGQIFYGLGAWKVQILDYYDEPNGYKNWIKGQFPLLAEAREAGLKVHLYTYRNEDRYLAWDFHQNPIEEYLYSMRNLGVDGYFSDFPGTLSKAIDMEYGTDENREPCTSKAIMTMRHGIGQCIVTILFIAITVMKCL